MNHSNIILKSQLIDESITLRDITNKVKEEDKGLGQCWNYRTKSDIARERWEMLAKALLKPQKNYYRAKKFRGISVRRFSSFDLFKPTLTGEYNHQFAISIFFSFFFFYFLN